MAVRFSRADMTDSHDPATLALHADDHVEDAPDVAPPLHLATTYDADNAAGLVYGRNDTATRRRLEAVLGALEGGHAVTYASGQAAAHAALRHLRLQGLAGRVLIDRGYHGTHALLAHFRAEGVETVALDSALRAGDVVWLETPRNPTCALEDIAAHARRAEAAGARLVVDSTFATPILQQPLALGAHLVMHSSTKFLAGHSDALGGVLVAPTAEQARALRAERTVLGAMPGALETWLTLRSLRTLALRVERQSATATALAAWLEGRVPRVWHPSRPGHPGHALLGTQMRGPGGVLSIELADAQAAQALPGRLRLFRDATSLGGVESLIEWRRRHDPAAPEGLVRISCGLEAPEDLIADLARGLEG
jgi:cystathionine gamma-synthase